MERNDFSYFFKIKGAVLNPFFVMILSITQVWSQNNNDYILKLTADTVRVKVIRIDKHFKEVLCEENGKKVKYAAKDVLVLKCDTAFYETGLVRIRKLKSKQYVFLKRTVKGRLNLYEMAVKRTKFQAKAFGDDFIHLRWVYRAQPWFKSVPTTALFYRKDNETRESYSKTAREKTKDCKLLQDKINSRAWTPTPNELVEFYNRNCKQ